MFALASCGRSSWASCSAVVRPSARASGTSDRAKWKSPSMSCCAMTADAQRANRPWHGLVKWVSRVTVPVGSTVWRSALPPRSLETSRRPLLSMSRRPSRGSARRRVSVASVTNVSLRRVVSRRSAEQCPQRGAEGIAFRCACCKAAVPPLLARQRGPGVVAQGDVVLDRPAAGALTLDDAQAGQLQELLHVRRIQVWRRVVRAGEALRPNGFGDGFAGHGSPFPFGVPLTQCRYDSMPV